MNMKISDASLARIEVSQQYLNQAQPVPILIIFLRHSFLNAFFLLPMAKY